MLDNETRAILSRIERLKLADEANQKAEWESLPEEEKARINAEREQVKKELEINMSKEQREKQIEEWKSRGVTPRYYGASWENWAARTPAQRDAFEKVKTAWSRNLFLTGSNGTGKTHLGMCLSKDGAVYRRLVDIFYEVRGNLNDEQKIRDYYGNCKLLVIDEAGRQKFTGFENIFFFDIIDLRWNNMLPTTIITNLSTSEFTGIYGTAVLDRLRPEIVLFDWESKRGIGGRREQ